MLPETRRIVDLAVAGLADRTDYLYYQLTKRELTYRQKYTLNGPFHKALAHVADIADGGEISDRQAAQQDVYLVFSVLDLLPGMYQNAAKEMLQRARLRLVPETERLTYEQAAEVMGVNSVLIDLDVSSRFLHPLVFEDGDSFAFFLDLDEVLNLKINRQKSKDMQQKWKEEREKKEHEAE